MILKYDLKEGKPTQIMHQEKVNLKDDDYKVYLSYEDNNSTLRYLQEIEIETVNATIYPKNSGIGTIKINLNKNLETLNYLFENIDDIIYVDLSKVNTSKIKEMKHTFDGCTNLQKVNIKNLDTSHILRMEYLFANCINLIEIEGIDNFNTHQVKDMTGMFINCINIISLNLSSFKFNDIVQLDNMFYNTTNLKFINITDLNKIENIFNNIEINHTISILVNQINTSDINTTSNIHITNTLPFIQCVTGINEKCKECNGINCKSCNEGYYISNLEYKSQEVCQKCKEGCINCIEDNNGRYICNKCNDDYVLYNNKCIKNAEIGDDYKCASINNNPGMNDQCGSCNPTYYFNKKYYTNKCIKIGIENCKFAKINKEPPECEECFSDYYLSDNKCKLKCKIGSEKKCKKCLPYSNNYNNSCYECNSGYYLDKDISTTECQSCNILNCSECIKNKSIICTKCNKGYSYIDGKCIKDCNLGEDGNKCKTCNYNINFIEQCLQCNLGYYLPNNIYESDNITLINKNICYKCQDNCEICIGNTTKDSKCIKCFNGYKLNKDGICEFHCNAGKNEKCLTCKEGVINECEKCNPGYLLPIDTTNTSKCSKCNETNCKICEGRSLGGYQECIECNEGYTLLYNKCYKKCIIGNNASCKLCGTKQNNINECLECNPGYYLPNDIKNKTICTKCKLNNCYECIGDSINPKCKVCDENYKLINGKCVKKCILGKDEKCLSCNYDNGKEGQCLMCNIGYTLYGDNTTCIKCNENITNCTSNFNPICMNDTILSGNKCIKKCNIGNKELCLECNSEEGRINECGKCNKNYFIADDTNKTKCILCNIKNCVKCKGSINEYECIECESGYRVHNGICEISIDNNCEKYIGIPGLNETCKTCKEGYFIPSNPIKYNLTENKCYPCSKSFDNCLKCAGESEFADYCLKCKEPYVSIGGSICYKTCDMLYDENCNNCEYSNFYPYVICNRCNEGYFLSTKRENIKYLNKNEYNKCNECKIHGCRYCYGEDENNNICTKCYKKFKNPSYDINNESIILSCESSCELGENEKCKTCTLNGKCATCNKGYRLKEGKCVSCDNNSIRNTNCEKCSDSINGFICHKCFEPYSLIYNQCINDTNTKVERSIKKILLISHHTGNNDISPLEPYFSVLEEIEIIKKNYIDVYNTKFTEEFLNDYDCIVWDLYDGGYNYQFNELYNERLSNFVMNGGALLVTHDQFTGSKSNTPLYLVGLCATNTFSTKYNYVNVLDTNHSIFHNYYDFSNKTKFDICLTHNSYEKFYSGVYLYSKLLMNNENLNYLVANNYGKGRTIYQQVGHSCINEDEGHIFVNSLVWLLYGDEYKKINN